MFFTGDPLSDFDEYERELRNRKQEDYFLGDEETDREIDERRLPDVTFEGSYERILAML